MQRASCPFAFVSGHDAQPLARVSVGIVVRTGNNTPLLLARLRVRVVTHHGWSRTRWRRRRGRSARCSLASRDIAYFDPLQYHGGRE